MKISFDGTVVKVALIVLILFGIGIGFRELIHMRDETHEFSWLPFAFAAGLVLFPALAFDTSGRIKSAIAVFSDNIQSVRSGRRSTDPIIPVPTVVVKKDENEGLG